MGNLEVALCKVATITMGTSPKGTTYNHEGIGLPLLNGPTEFGEIYPNCTLYTTDSKKECKIGDLIFCVRGSTTGRMNWTDRLYSLGRGVCSIRGETPLDTKYIRYCIEWRLNALLNLSGGSTFPNLTKDTIRNFPIPYPESRSKIAAILSTYDDLIENHTRRIEILEEMAGTIYRQWFVEFRFPGYENVKMVESELGLIPQGWEVKRLADLVETQYGYTESATEDEVGPKFVRGKDINKNSYIDWDTVPFCPIESEKYAKYRLHADDILVIRMADPGKVAIIEKEIDAVFASYLIRLKLRSNRLSPYYLFYMLLDERYQDYIYGVSTGTTRKSASAGVITGFDLVVPADEVRNRFEVVIASLRKALNNLLEKNTNLRQTRDLLLPKLISGELDVSELDIDTDGIQPKARGDSNPVSVDRAVAH